MNCLTCILIERVKVIDHAAMFVYMTSLPVVKVLVTSLPAVYLHPLY